MTWGIFNWAGNKIASEVHKSKIEQLENRILEMERKHAVIMKSIEDNCTSLDKMEQKVEKATFESAKASGTIETLKQLVLTKNRQDEK